jgi:hypothetical protein
MVEVQLPEKKPNKVASVSNAQSKKFILEIWGVVTG